MKIILVFLNPIFQQKNSAVFVFKLLDVTLYLLSLDQLSQISSRNSPNLLKIILIVAFILQGIPLNEFADVYFKRFSKPIINKYSGFDNIDDLLEAMRKIVYVRDDTNGIKMVRPTYHRMQEWKITKEENNGTTILGQPIIPQMVRTNLKDLIQNYSNGLRLELLGEIYQKKYKEKLDVSLSRIKRNKQQSLYFIIK